MKTINVTVSKSDVYEQVKQRASHIAKKLDMEGSEYERVNPFDKDTAEIEQMWDDSANILREEFRPFTQSGIDEVQGIYANLSLPDRATVIQDDLENQVKMYMVFAILRRWMMVTNRPDADRYETEAGQRRERIHSALWDRKPKAATMSANEKKWINF